MEQNTTKKPDGKILIYIGLILAIAAIIVFFSIERGVESTDNAQIDGNIVPLRAEITGNISRINFTDNQFVHRGDTLIVFDTIEPAAKLLQAQAALQQAQINLDIAAGKARTSSSNAQASASNTLMVKESVIAAKANLDKNNAQFQRIKDLLAAKAATQEQYDNANAALLVAQADYQKAIAQEKSTSFSADATQQQAGTEQSQIELAKLTIKQKEAEFKLATEQFKRAFILAPCNGVVSKRAVQKGQYVSTGQSLCSLIDKENIWISANLKETQLANLKKGQSVEIRIDAYPGKVFNGVVESLNGATGSKFSLFPPDNATGNFIKVTQRFPLRIAFTDKKQMEELDLFPGLSAVVKIKTQ